MQNSENQQALSRILDMSRMISIALIFLHFYYYCYAAFADWQLVSAFSDKVLTNIEKAGLFAYFNKSKFIALGFLLISLIGVKGKKTENLRPRKGAIILMWGLAGYFLPIVIFSLGFVSTLAVCCYIAFVSIGFSLVLSGGTLLSRVIYQKLNGGDIFNKENETFPQEQRLLTNEYSVNLPARFRLKDKVHGSWINIINPFRGTLVCGSPGSGKSYFVIRHIISQHISKGFCAFIYDFKFDDLSLIAYNCWLENQSSYAVAPKFYTINFDDLNKSHRCNPLDAASMFDITDAGESARTILLGLNREWIRKQGDFFVESPINFLTAVIWFLRRYNDGEFCTLPHVIELMQLDYEKLFTILRTEKQIEVLINPFITAYLNDAMEQLEGQIASAKIALARLSSPQLYYVLSGNDFSLDINNPKEPKIVCVGNNPQKIQIYGAVLSLYVNRLVKIVNKKGKIKSSLVFDEFPTIYLSGIDSLIATARSNKVATTLGIQDFSQLRKDYGKEQADVIVNITGNIISGQVTGDTARQLSERFGKIMQDRTSLSINRTDTSISKSKQLDLAIPASKIAGLSSGEFVGMMADNPDQKIDLKTFHCEIINDHKAIQSQQDKYRPIPQVREINESIVTANFLQIKEEVQLLADSEIEKILADPARRHLMVRKKAK
ncbi:conjugal transfer protein TraG [Dyadobacter luteus]|uniref:Conjugal transfer protein TraG n=1 Tax=Dyadobacter luteus TaxID=2259619 RepID=A0A3D8YI36_9BACT|nr:conjugal transfer protein MobC [Dyadobacter luteus]REA64496.1 conjugal transfer protein TraG [Dyadobacter luteus]